MLSDQTARVPSVAARLTSKARCVRYIIFWQITRVEDLVRVIVGHRDLGRRYERELSIVLYMKQIVLKFWQLVGPKECRTVYQEWRQCLGVTMLAGVDLEHQVYQGTLEPGTGSIENGEA